MRSGLMGLVFVACGPSPTLTDLTPIVGSARGGEPVVVSGTDLYAGLGVELDGVAAEVLDVAQDGLSMTIATPAHLAGPVDVRLVDEDDAVLGVLGDAFAYEPIALDFIPAAAAYLPADVPDLRMAVPADIDEDGVLDLLVVETAGALRYWRGSGTGVFEAQPLPWTQGR
ncbi:MAG: IPT/TIG domain-containing protein, partial [Myxococcota bacterium]